MNVEAILAAKGREVRTVAPEAAVGEALRRMRDERVGALVVSADGATVAGIVSDRDVLYAIADRGVGRAGRAGRRGDDQEVVTCSAGDRVGALMATMTDRRIRHIPVVGADGRLGGIVSIGDVVKHHLDEVRGEADAMREYIAGAAG
jgi:CBS domain-containing protein